MSNIVVMYKKFERFWHWMQALLIFTMVFTGLEIHGVYSVLGFEKAVNLHNIAAWSWVVLFVLIIVWLFTTGEWKQYIPTMNGMIETMKFYAFGIFKGESHPHKKSLDAKLNPVQRMAYLQLLAFLAPIQILTGVLYFFFHQWGWLGLSGRIDAVALIHTFIAYSIITFVIVHIYMTTTGHTVTAHIKAMITGVEDLDEH